MGAKAEARIKAPGPKRILALDGGGVRGIITIAFLDRIEKLLAERFKQQGRIKDVGEFRLSHYFDLIGGTSVGSLLAVMLARGERVADVKVKFREWAPLIFRKPLVPIPVILPRFGARDLERILIEVVGTETLESDKLETAIALFAKRANTGSPWVLTNNPANPFWPDKVEEGKFRLGNRHFRLRDVLRASTAAPYYFAPKKMQILLQLDEETAKKAGGDTHPEEGLFVDGGISPYNNPALKLLMLAGVEGYGFKWKLGADELLITSIGTGFYRVRTTQTWLNRLVPAVLAAEALQGMIANSQSHALELLQWMSRPNRPWTIDSEIDDLRNDEMFALCGMDKPMLSFARYDVRLEHAWLEKRKLSTSPNGRFSNVRLNQLRDFTDPRDILRNYDLGARAAEYQVQGNDFPAVFDNLPHFSGKPA